MRVPPLVHEALLDALALAAPVECAGCGAPDRALCAACRRRLEPAPRRVAVPGVPCAWAGTAYDGPVRGAVLALKDGRTGLADPLAPLLLAALAAVRAEQSAQSPGVELCPVPASRRALRRRGYDPVRVLVRAAGLDAARVLRPARSRVEQKSLGREERLRAGPDRFRARADLGGRRLVLVDDVVTTGATLRAVAEAVRAAGGEVVGAVALAAVTRSGGSRSALGGQTEMGS